MLLEGSDEEFDEVDQDIDGMVLLFSIMIQ